MKWVLKAATQKGLSALPHSQDANYLLQYRVTKTLPRGDRAFRRKVERAFQHYEAFAARSPRDPSEATFYEFGTGWDLVVPLAYYALGVNSQILIDIQPNVRPPLVNDTINRFTRLQPELESFAERSLRSLGDADITSHRDFSIRFGMDYRAPVDARDTGLTEASIDFVSSTNTLEHIPEADITLILAECRRILRSDGSMSCRIDLRDHYSYFDPSVSTYAFLTRSDVQWRLANSSLHFQNRLRRPDYLTMFDAAGFDIVEEHSAAPTAADLDFLRHARLAPRFRCYAPEDLGVKSMAVVARPRNRFPAAA